MSIVWEDTDGCAKKYRCDLAIILMTVLSYLYGIIMNHVNNAPGHGKNVVDVINATEKYYLKEQMELLGKLSSYNTSKIGILPSA